MRWQNNPGIPNPGIPNPGIRINTVRHYWECNDSPSDVCLIFTILYKGYYTQKGRFLQFKQIQATNFKVILLNLIMLLYTVKCQCYASWLPQNKRGATACMTTAGSNAVAPLVSNIIARVHVYGYPGYQGGGTPGSFRPGL